MSRKVTTAELFVNGLSPKSDVEKLIPALNSKIAENECTGYQINRLNKK